MSERDYAPSVEASLRSAVTLLDERGPAAVRMTIEEILSTLPGGRARDWTASQEARIRALVNQMNTVRNLDRAQTGWWGRRKARRARQRLTILMRVAGPKLVDEAALRCWKAAQVLEILRDFTAGRRDREDVARVLDRLRIVHTATYLDLRQAA
ncbi:hypothetical protein [Streptomyces sp. NBC_01565]|uniref:hypothetical protein n=1 Tax=unclassified Streptomyces TaxID=2593676 RepID=UPI002250348A|nr:hypothetical protein [Streptomyces sp. NBC_01565]MCX4547003.1 hypothetical protein [Streptomyces sp. NBC_01565]